MKKRPQKKVNHPKCENCGKRNKSVYHRAGHEVDLCDKCAATLARGPQ
jgi:ribosomal protein L37AE/L43A